MRAGVDCYRNLAARYDAGALAVRRSGVSYPAAIERFDSLSGVRARLAAGPLRADPELAAAGAVHLARRRRANPLMHDGSVLALVESGRDGLRVASSSYFAMIATCDALRDEFERRGVGPLRERAETLAAGDPLHDGRGRAAAVGVTVAVTITGPAGGRSLIIGRRSSALAADPGRWDVAPSGMAEPGAGGSDLLLGNAERELAEELGLDPARCGGLRALGLAHDLLRLKPDVVYALDLDADLGSDAELGDDEFESTRLLELSPESLDQFWEGRDPDSLTPAAAGAIALLEAELEGRGSGQSSS